MMSKRVVVSMVLGSAVALGATVVNADEQFTYLSDVQVKPMTAEQMTNVEGMAHTSFTLGALLVENTNGRVAATPAWTAGHGLHPSRALSRAQVPD